MTYGTHTHYVGFAENARSKIEKIIWRVLGDLKIN